MDLINSDDNMDELFCIKIYNDGVIRCRIYTDLKNNHVIENDIDHKIEFIEQDNQTFIEASQIEKQSNKWT